MNLREYEHITRSPDTFPRSTLEAIYKVLCNVNSGNASIIQEVLEIGYIKPPQEYKWHGVYRVTLNTKQKQAILNELEMAIIELSDAPSYQGNKFGYIKQFYNYWKRYVEENPIPYEEAIRNQQYYDLREMSIEEFENFIFNHNITNDSNEDNRWYHDHKMWIDYDTNGLIKLYIALFKQSHELLKKFSRDKLEQGFWAIIGPGLCECSVYDLVWGDRIDIVLRENLITSMYDLYKNLFTVDPLETSSNMWWDALAYGFNPMKQRSRNNPLDCKIQDTMFSTLCKILDLDSEACRIAALHGLGHLNHPDTEEVVKTHLNKYANLKEEYKAYALACLKGEIM